MLPVRMPQGLGSQPDLAASQLSGPGQSCKALGLDLFSFNISQNTGCFVYFFQGGDGHRVLELKVVLLGREAKVPGRQVTLCFTVTYL